MITLFNKGIIWKGSDCEVAVRLSQPCSNVDFGEVDSLTVDFYTADGGMAVTKTMEDFSISGQTGVTHFQWEELDGLEDGVIRYAVTIEIGGETTVTEMTSGYYLKSPADYTQQDFFKVIKYEDLVGGDIHLRPNKDLIDAMISEIETDGRSTIFLRVYRFPGERVPDYWLLGLDYYSRSANTVTLRFGALVNQHFGGSNDYEPLYMYVRIEANYSTGMYFVSTPNGVILSMPDYVARSAITEIEETISGLSSDDYCFFINAQDPYSIPDSECVRLKDYLDSLGSEWQKARVFIPDYPFPTAAKKYFELQPMMFLRETFSQYHITLRGIYAAGGNVGYMHTLRISSSSTPMAIFTRTSLAFQNSDVATNSLVLDNDHFLQSVRSMFYFLDGPRAGDVEATRIIFQGEPYRIEEYDSSPTAETETLICTNVGLASGLTDTIALRKLAFEFHKATSGFTTSIYDEPYNLAEIAQGRTGPQGPQGEVGPQGPQGPAGSGGGSNLTPTFLRFGNDQRGGLTYDGDNDCFLYDGGTIPTGDTSTSYTDLIDGLLTDALTTGGLVFDYLLPINQNNLRVLIDSEYEFLSHPALSVKDITPVTIGGVEFVKEIVYDYGHYIMTAWWTPHTNAATNLRMDFR